MAMENKGLPLEYLRSLGFNPDESYTAPDDPMEASRASINAFVQEHMEAVGKESIGFIHITGSAVKNNSAPLKSVAKVIAAVQDGVEAIGGSLEGFLSSRGRIPIDVSGRTQLSMVASPMPGSVVIQIAPTLPREFDLYPEGPALFDIEKETNAEPLADQAIGELSDLINELSAETPDKGQVLDRLTDLGPRVATAVKELCQSVSSSGVDVDFSWKQPGREEKKSSISAAYAKSAVSLIENANIESEEETIEGILITITESNKDKLRVLLDNGVEEQLSIGSISPVDLAAVNTGDRVRITATRSVSSRAGGRKSERLEGVALERVPKLPDKKHF
jgi:hypothetical protein